MPNKVIVTNRTALTGKYGQAGLTQIQAALTTMIAADRSRNVITQVVNLDDVVQMAYLNAPPVTIPGNDQQNKNAIDGVVNALNPVFLMILDGPDVVTQQGLTNPAYNANNPDGDPDPLVPSDLPYACSAPYSKDPATFTNPTRMVSRLPGVTSNTPGTAVSPAVLVREIVNAANVRSLSATAFRQYFSAAMQVSQTSQMVVSTVFGNANNFFTSPPDGPEWTTAQYQQMAHYFGVHGSSNDPAWYGQAGNAYPVAVRSQLLAGQTSFAMVCTSLACYGAQLYPANVNGTLPICNTYVSNGALGFFGSTVVSYSGPRAAPPRSGDLFCQTFMQAMLAGGSLGSLLLSARTRYIANAGVLSAVDLKTIAEFLTYGDPSLTLAPPPAPLAEAVPVGALPPESLDYEQTLVVAAAHRAAAAGPTPHARRNEQLVPSQAVRDVIARFAAQAGWSGYAITPFEVTGGPGVPEPPAALGLPDRIYVAVSSTSAASDPVKIYQFIEVFERAGAVIHVRTGESN
jgi:Peptidase family C25